MEVGGDGIDEVTSTTGVLPYHSDTLNPSDILSFAKQIAAAMVRERERDRDRDKERERERDRSTYMYI